MISMVPLTDILNTHTHSDSTHYYFGGQFMKKFFCKVFVFLMGLVFSSCVDSPTAEYGPPSTTYTTYIIDGTVADSFGSPVEGIEVSLKDYKNPGELVYSDEDGNWFIYLEDIDFYCQNSCELKAIDVDGEENGIYQKKIIALDLEKTVEGSGKDRGVYEQHGIKVVLHEL